MDFEIYYDDLTPEAQARHDKAQEEMGWASDTNNHDIVPLATLGIEQKKENA